MLITTFVLKRIFFSFLKIQFVLISIQMVYFVLSDFPHPPLLTWFTMSQAAFFFILFGNFYIKTYCQKENKQS